MIKCVKRAGCDILGIMSITAAMYCNPEREIDLSKVWVFESDELSELGNKNLEQLIDKEFPSRDKYIDLCWTFQAINEFQDLQVTFIPQRGKYLQQNYCYYESLSTLKEACLCGINGCMHTSLSGFRSALELILLHTYWNYKNMNSTDFSKFYEWLISGKNKPAFKALVNYFQEFYVLPENWNLCMRIRNLFTRLCSYSHTPLIDESIISIRDTNMPIVSEKLLQYWISISYDVADIILHILIAAYPICLFPVNIIHKFGFNVPVGAFFDRFNAVPLKRALGEERWEKYVTYFNSNPNVIDKLSWYSSQPDMILTDILKTWTQEDGPLPENVNTLDDQGMIIMIANSKAKMRTLLLSYTYGVTEMEVINYDPKNGITFANLI